MVSEEDETEWSSSESDAPKMKTQPRNSKIRVPRNSSRPMRGIRRRFHHNFLSPLVQRNTGFSPLHAGKL